jgi:hypothetical protein
VEIHIFIALNLIAVNSQSTDKDGVYLCPMSGASFCPCAALTGCAVSRI